MSTIYFNFAASHRNHWTMRNACQEISTNPAPNTSPCIYIIHNALTNNTYVGYADNAKKRWQARVETFHCLGIHKKHAKKILCAYCIPYTLKTSGKRLTYSGPLKGTNSPEHLLIRAVARGVLGRTTITNTQLCNTRYMTNNNIDRLEIHLPDLWRQLGQLETNKKDDITNFY